MQVLGNSPEEQVSCPFRRQFKKKDPNGKEKADTKRTSKEIG